VSGGDKPPAKAVTRTVIVDPDTGEQEVWVNVNLRAPLTKSDVQALVESLRAASPAGRLASLRARATALPEEIPERAAAMEALDRAEALLAGGADFWPIDAALEKAARLLDRGFGRREIRRRRASAASAGRKGGEQSAATRSKAERDAKLVREYDIERQKHGRDAAAIIAKRFGISASQVRKIVARERERKKRARSEA
jgi:hypothetical protein